MRIAWLCAAPLLFLFVPVSGQEAKKETKNKIYEVPYRLTTTQHILVRIKLNGKGPFNLILDTGAPVFYLSPKVCRRVGVEPDKRNWGQFDRFELEGGLILRDVKGRVEEPPQLQGMNTLGLAGAELHGVLGYSVFARYRMEIDFTKDKMTWTELDFRPPAPQGIGDGRSAPPEMDAIGGMAKLMTGLLGKRGPREELPRGFVGMEIDDGGGKVSIWAVLSGSPAEKAGLKAGDQVTHVGEVKVSKAVELHKALSSHQAGQKVRLTIVRGESTQSLTVTLGEGL